MEDFSSPEGDALAARAGYQCDQAKAQESEKAGDSVQQVSNEDLQKLRDLERERNELMKDISQQRKLRSSMLAFHEPGALQAERQVHLRLGPDAREVDIVVAQDAAAAQGGLLWSSGIVLARYLASGGLAAAISRSGRGPSTARILELGCGAAALPSMIAAALVRDAKVVATDLPEVVTLALANIARNAAALGFEAGAGVEMMPYSWSESAEPPCSPHDVILAADLLYDASCHAALVSAVLAAIARDSGIAIFAYKERDAGAESQFFQRLQRAGAHVARNIQMPESVTSADVLDIAHIRLAEVSFEFQDNNDESAEVDFSNDGGLYL